MFQPNLRTLWFRNKDNVNLLKCLMTTLDNREIGLNHTIFKIYIFSEFMHENIRDPRDADQRCMTLKGILQNLHFLGYIRGIRLL